VLEETRLTRPSALPDYVDTLVTEETLTSSKPVVIAHVISDERVVISVATVAVLAAAIVLLSWLWAAGYAGVVFVALVIAVAAATAGRW
jgi:hypothetical protein